MEPRLARRPARQTDGKDAVAVAAAAQKQIRTDAMRCDMKLKLILILDWPGQAPALRGLIDAQIQANRNNRPAWSRIIVVVIMLHKITSFSFNIPNHKHWRSAEM